MTRQQTSALYSATAKAMAAVHALHPTPPAELVRASIRCPKCGGRLAYTASETGKTSGKCSSRGCVTWPDF